MNFLKTEKVQELEHLPQFPKIEKLQEIKKRGLVLVSQKRETNNSGDKYMEINS